MENKSAHCSIWNPVATAPTNVELELCIYDSGEYHALAFPCRRNGVGWSDVRLNKMVASGPPIGGYGRAIAPDQGRLNCSTLYVTELDRRPASGCVIP